MQLRMFEYKAEKTRKGADFTTGSDLTPPADKPVVKVPNKKEKAVPTIVVPQ